MSSIRRTVGRAALRMGLAAFWVAAAAQGTERVYLVEQPAPAGAPYSFRSLGEVAGARRAAVPETGGHVLVLTAEGRVWGWGQNLYGQLGPGDSAVWARFAEVAGVTEVTALAAGAQHSVALRSDGTVWAWGANTEGQLGDGSLVNRARPGVVPGLREVSMVAAGALFTVALKADGTVWAFGSNWSGIAGTEGRKLVTEPVRVEGLSDVRGVAVRVGLGYALDGAGRIWVWGRDGASGAGSPRLLSEAERTAELAEMLNPARGGPRLDAEWTGTAGRGRRAEAAGPVLRIADGRGLQEFPMEGTGIDVATGWAVVVISGKEAASGGDGLPTGSARHGSGLEPGLTNPAAASMGVGRAASTVFTQVSASGYTTLAVRGDGAVRAWGSNTQGQIGDGSGVRRMRPSCTLLSGVVGLSTSYYHSIAVLQDSTVWTWGSGELGVLGNDLLKQHYRATPDVVPGLSGVVAVAAGERHNLALKSDGSVWAWGANDSGQLGDGTTNTTGRPVQVSGLTGIVAIAAGVRHSLALKGDGSVYAWGANDYGQLGTGGYVEQHAAVLVPGLKAASLAAGSFHSLAVKADGTVWGWGYNSVGQLGPGAAETQLSPVRMTGYTDVRQVAGGPTLTAVVRTDGSLWAWGSNWDYDTSKGIYSITPVGLPVPEPVESVALGQKHIVILLKSGSVRGWGSNANGQLGRSDLATTAQFVAPDAEAPCSTTAPEPWSMGQRLTAGQGMTVMLREDGTVWTVGDVFGSIATKNVTPIQVPGLPDTVGISSRLWMNAALGRDGLVRTWQMWGARSIPVGVTSQTYNPATVPGVMDATKIATGNSHTLAVKTDGTVWAWGYNQSGEVGSGVLSTDIPPGQVAGIDHVLDIAAGGRFSLALKSDGTVWAWGANEEGQLGDGTYTDRWTPVQVRGLSNILAISAGDNFGVALKRDGTVWTWGGNRVQQLGQGVENYLGAGFAMESFPILGIVRVVDLTDVVAISGGGGHVLAIRADGTVWSWGQNNFGQVGNGGLTTVARPVQVPGLYGVVAVAAGFAHSMAWKRDGRLIGWGWNGFGQLAYPAVSSTQTLVQSGFAPQAPVASSPTDVTPASGSGASGAFQLSFRASGGYASLQWVQLLFGTAADGGGQPYCFLHYDVRGKGLWLYGDGGFFEGPVAPGTATNALQNVYCGVNPKVTTITGSGAILTIQTQVIFKQAGSRKIYLRSRDLYEVDSGWIQQGTWDSAAAPLATASVNPSTGSGAAPTFAASFVEQSALPANSGGWVQLLVGAAADGGGQPFCYLHYDRAGDGLWMYSSDAGFFAGPVKPGVSSTVLDSSACTINTGGTTVQSSTNQLVLTAPLTLKGPMAGSKKIFQRSMDALRRDTGWVQTGTWIVP
ncbi:RCC1 domain-containing protein [Paludibaculum fermentans]|uniref:RCC1 domain-containing protein n=1 Tax=Paludibaculum fermentans TaxID=1473598 RepID=UPI003EBC79ED